MKTGDAFTLAQKGALITLAVVALWSLGAAWLPLTRPLGINYTEILFLSALVPGYLVLLPLYGLRVRWSYLNGILVMLGLFVGLAKSILDNTFFFSWSAYNLTAVREPEQMRVGITEDGVEFGQRFYPYEDIENFWIAYHPPEVKRVYFKLKGLRPRLSIHLDDINPVKLRNTLTEYVDEDLENDDELSNDLMGRLLKI